MDPYVLASKYCHKFVNIHPFLDGDGRMCRLIMNGLLRISRYLWGEQRKRETNTWGLRLGETWRSNWGRREMSGSVGGTCVLCLKKGSEEMEELRDVPREAEW